MPILYEYENHDIIVQKNIVPRLQKIPLPATEVTQTVLFTDKGKDFQNDLPTWQ